MPIERMLWPGRPVTDEDINAFEAEEGVKLPEDYRAFLKKWNGGRPVPDAFVIPDRRGGSLFDVLFRLGSEKKVSDLREQAHQWHKRLPVSLMPIGADAGGSIIALGVHGEHYGKVYFFDLFDPQETMAGITEIAPTFQAFLDGIHEYKPKG